MSLRVTVLGSGTSYGVPNVACRCQVCTSPDPRDARTRCSIVVNWRGKSLLVDTAPELRLQAIRSHVTRVDAVLFTHAHADHVTGLDDLRQFCELQGAELPIFGRESTLADLRRMFPYAFSQPQQPGLIRPRVIPHPLPGDRLDWEGLAVEAIPVFHGKMEVLAYRFDAFAYVTDVSRIPLESLERLRGLDTLILDALRWEEHPTHFSVGQALAVVEELRPRRAFFTHMTHNLLHAATDARLPSGVRLAYDGLRIEIP